MSWKYLKDKKWIEVTRDERFFCTHLYFKILKNNLPFLKMLLEKKVINMQEANSSLWEVGYEVCFYRDFIHSVGIDGNKKIGRTIFSKLRKRTFDLCMFSQNKIIIIEAKAQQGFAVEQMNSFMEDEELIKELVGQDISIKLVALASSKYSPKKETKKNFDAIINWQQIQSLYPNDIFLRANEIYKK